MEAEHSSTAVSNDGNNSNVDGEGVFSEESSFRGSAEVKAAFEERASKYNPKAYWDIVQWNVQCLAARSAQRLPQGTKRKRDGSSVKQAATIEKASDDLSPGISTTTKPNLNAKAMKPYNPYEGDKSAKQLHESLDEFLDRLKPSTATIAGTGPWVWIANPYSSFRPTSENIGAFKQEASKALAEYLSCKSQLEHKQPDKAAGAITRMLKPEREMLEEQILTFAKQFGVTSGKWMLFPPPEDVDKIWATVARACFNNELGSAAKVGTDDGDPSVRYRLLCIYTVDFSDVQDVGRVLRRIRELGLLGNDASRSIYYKSDAYTHLDIASNNEYKLKASMYNSKDLFSEMAT